MNDVCNDDCVMQLIRMQLYATKILEGKKSQSMCLCHSGVSLLNESMFLK